MKDLEIEYKNQVATEIPDLWARIEAGINAVEVQNTSVQINNVPNVTEFKSKKNNSKKIITIFSSVVAAAACLVLAFTFILGSKNRKDETKAAVAMAESTSNYAESEDRFALFDSADTKKEKSIDEDTMTESAMAEAPMEAEVCEEAAYEEEAEYMDNSTINSETSDAANGGLQAEANTISLDVQVVNIYTEGNDNFIEIEDLTGVKYLVYIPDVLVGDIETLESVKGFVTITLSKYKSDEEKNFGKEKWSQVDYEFVSLVNP